jgi:hypothetical protein
MGMRLQVNLPHVPQCIVVVNAACFFVSMLLLLYWIRALPDRPVGSQTNAWLDLCFQRLEGLRELMGSSCRHCMCMYVHAAVDGQGGEHTTQQAGQVWLGVRAGERLLQAQVGLGLATVSRCLCVARGWCGVCGDEE